MSLSRLASWSLLASVCASCMYTDPVAAQFVINEIGATGSDFVEFYNTGTTPVDISGYGATDSRKDGLPRISRTIRFPANTVIPAGGRVLVLFEGECPTSLTPFVCIRGLAGGVSQTHGENVHLISPENRVAATANYPANAAPSGFTWGRFPEGTGEFAITRRTPGAVNSR